MKISLKRGFNAIAKSNIIINTEMWNIEVHEG